MTSDLLFDCHWIFLHHLSGIFLLVEFFIFSSTQFRVHQQSLFSYFCLQDLIFLLSFLGFLLQIFHPFWLPYLSQCHINTASLKPLLLHGLCRNEHFCVIPSQQTRFVWHDPLSGLSWTYSRGRGPISLAASLAASPLGGASQRVSVASISSLVAALSKKSSSACR